MMMRAVKSVSSHRGRDPRDFVLLAFGGNGGVFGAELARSLNIRRVIVPPAAGVFSALGLLLADVELGLSHSFLQPLDRLDPETIEAMLWQLEDEIARRLSHRRDQLRFVRSADLRYAGQAFELGVALPDRPLGGDGVQRLAAAFEDEHMRTYGHRFPGNRTVETVNLRVTGSLINGARPNFAAVCEREREDVSGCRQTYFGGGFGVIETPVLRRSQLGGDAREGPLIIEEYEGTTVVPPRSRAGLDTHGNIAIDLDM
jgi:N-methylhydantoinase A